MHTYRKFKVRRRLLDCTKDVEKKEGKIHITLHAFCFFFSFFFSSGKYTHLEPFYAIF